MYIMMGSAVPMFQKRYQTLGEWSAERGDLLPLTSVGFAQTGYAVPQCWIPWRTWRRMSRCRLPVNPSSRGFAKLKINGDD